MTILFLDTVHPMLREGLIADGYKCIDGTTWSRAEVLLRLKGIHGIVLRSRITLDREFLDAASDLRFIARSGAGMENIDTEYAVSKSVVCLHAPEGNRDAVGEHATAMLLMVLNKLGQADRDVRMGNWNREDNRGVELNEKTVGLIGYGNMGRAFAQRLSGFGCHVIAYDKYLKEWPDENALRVTLQELQAQADVISLHVPLTDETRYLIDADFLSRFEKPVIVINTARGSCVSIRDLVESMKSGRVTGACLDVLEYEDASFEKFNLKSAAVDQLPEWRYLIASEKVVLSPHIAGWTIESYRKLSEVLLEKIRIHFPLS
jgi:D-3-phosphoglycerate dehydrogenase